MKKNMISILTIIAGFMLGLQPLFAGVLTTNGASIAGAILISVGGYFLHRNIAVPQS